MNDQRLIEAVEVLDGSRNGDRTRAAVRIDDLKALLQIPPKLQATAPAGSTPTAAEYNTLLRDVAAMHARLMEVSAALQAVLQK